VDKRAGGREVILHGGGAARPRCGLVQQPWTDGERGVAAGLKILSSRVCRVG
jgi:hypothetical protein